MIECNPPEAPFNHFLTISLTIDLFRTSAVANFVLNEFFFDYSGIFSFYDCQKKFLKETCQINVCSCKYSLTFRARVVRVNFRTDRFNESTALAHKKTLLFMIILVQEYKTMSQKTVYCCILCSLIKNNKRNKLIWILFLSVNSLGNDKFMFTLQVSLQNYF